MYFAQSIFLKLRYNFGFESKNRPESVFLHDIDCNEEWPPISNDETLGYPRENGLLVTELCRKRCRIIRMKG